MYAERGRLEMVNDREMEIHTRSDKMQKLKERTRRGYKKEILAESVIETTV